MTEPEEPEEDFNYFYVCTNGGYIFYSDDLGETWETEDTAGQRRWSGIAGDDFGTVILACAFNDYIYRTDDVGSTWNPVANDLKRNWTGIACDKDCTIAIACATWNTENELEPGAGGLDDYSRGDYVYGSPDAGVTWDVINVNIGRYGNGKSLWSAVSCSADAKIMVASELFGNIWITYDFGQNWIKTGGYKPTFVQIPICMSDIKISGDGTVVSVISIPNKKDIGNAYTNPNSLGNFDWRRFPLSQKPNCTTLSDNGKKIVIGTRDSFIYVSTNSGFSFNQQRNSGVQNWSTVAISIDTKIILAAGYGSFIFISTDDGVTWNKTNSGEQQWSGSFISKKDQPPPT